MGDVAISTLPIPLGANGLVIHGNSAYVANTNFGRIVRVPILANGNAGQPEVFVEDRQLLGGADGLTVDRTGTLYVTANSADAIVSVSPAGRITTLASGGILQNPASIILWGNDLYITNMAILKPEGTRMPAVYRLPLAAGPAAPGQMPGK